MNAVGDVVYNLVTKEEGRIVRITDVNGEDACIVVLLCTENGETEALWRPSELELKKSEVKKNAEKRSRTQDRTSGSLPGF